MYSHWEFECMKRDIEIAKKYGANGVVFGILNQNGTIDQQRTSALVALAKPMRVTFHRAFDMTPNPVEALEAAIETGATTILTSGQRQTAIEGIETIAELVAASAGRIDTMAGAGVNATNAVQLAATGLTALHLTAKTTRPSLMTYRQPNLQMTSSLPSNEYEVVFSDFEKIEAIRRLFLPADGAPF